MTVFHLRATALAAACLLLATQTSAYTMENMCAQWSGQGYVGNPSDCTSWGYCKAQKLVSWGTCPKGTVFESQSGNCLSATSTPCATSVASTCSVMTNTAFVADPNDCTKYAYCFGNGKSQTKSCPSGQRYAANNNTCVWGPSCPQDTICRFMPNNIYVGDPNNCGQYLQCIKGYGVWGSCANDYFYNAATGFCQVANPCTGSGTDTGSNTGNANLPPAIDPTACAAADTFYSDGKTCYGFYYCKTVGGEGKWGACPFGTEFDSTLTPPKCVSPAATACELDRCANTNLTYAAVASTNCKEYTYCPNGATAYCPSGYQYYDEVNMKCVATKPSYAICA